jgi:hypothetical protein
MSEPVVASQAPPAVEWSKKPKIYPSFHKIASALQDLGSERKTQGKKNVKIGKLTRTYKELTALAKKVYICLYKEYYKDIEGGLDSNMNRGKQDMPNTVIFKCNHVDVSCCSVDFHQYAKNGKVFTLKAHDNKLPGLDMAIFDFQNRLVQSSTKHCVKILMMTTFSAQRAKMHRLLWPNQCKNDG